MGAPLARPDDGAGRWYSDEAAECAGMLVCAGMAVGPGPADLGAEGMMLAADDMAELCTDADIEAEPDGRMEVIEKLKKHWKPFPL